MSEISYDIFSLMERDAIGEILNISIGSSATAVSNMLRKRTDITTPRVEVSSIEGFEISSMEPAIAVEIRYIEGIEGNNILVLKKTDVKSILEILMMTEIPDEEFELDEMSLSAVCELMNQMMGASSTALAELIGEKIDISPPQAYEVDDVQDLKSKYFTDDNPVVVVRFDLDIEDVLKSEFLSVMPMDLAKRIISIFTMLDQEEVIEPLLKESNKPPVMDNIIIDNTAPIMPQPQPQPQPQYAPPQPQYEQQQPQYAPQPQYEQQQPQYAPQPQYVQQQPRVIQTSSPALGVFTNDPSQELPTEQAKNLDMLMSVPLEVSVEIGRTRKLIKDIVGFSQGTLVILDKLAGEQVDLYVNNQCIAKGDVVVIDDSFGVRITKILDKHELFNMK